MAYVHRCVLAETPGFKLEVLWQIVLVMVFVIVKKSRGGRVPKIVFYEQSIL
jgi:hypothetical protein